MSPRIDRTDDPLSLPIGQRCDARGCRPRTGDGLAHVCQWFGPGWLFRLPRHGVLSGHRFVDHRDLSQRNSGSSVRYRNHHSCLCERVCANCSPADLRSGLRGNHKTAETRAQPLRRVLRVARFFKPSSSSSCLPRVDQCYRRKESTPPGRHPRRTWTRRIKRYSSGITAAIPESSGASEGLHHARILSVLRIDELLAPEIRKAGCSEESSNCNPRARSATANEKMTQWLQKMALKPCVHPA